MEQNLYKQIYTNIRPICKDGGIGEIYIAYHNNLRKEVLLKRLKKDIMAEYSNKEVNILKDLHHTNLPVIYDYFLMDGVQYISEEFISGYNMEEWRQKWGFPTEELLLHWMRQLFRALYYLHTRRIKIIHCDIKPQNIMIDENESLFLIDFNISMLEGVDWLYFGCTDSYCSPEQYQAYYTQSAWGGKKIKPDVRMDIYSACATFYNLMSGITPTSKQRNLPLEKMKLPYSKELCRLVDMGMEWDPRKRIPSAEKVLEYLEHLEYVSVRYQLYSRLRTGISVAGIAMLSIGLILLLVGQEQSRNQAMEGKIRELYSYYQENGATKETEAQSTSLLEQNDRYWKQNPFQEAQLLAVSGEYYYELDTYGDYLTAASQYRLALEALACSEQSDALLEAYVLNYASALFMSGQITEAEQALTYYLPQRQDLYYVTELEYQLSIGEYGQVLEAAEEQYHQCTTVETQKLLCGIAVTAAEKEENWKAAVAWSQRKLRIQRNNALLRMIAVFCLNAGAEGDTSYYQQAIDYYDAMSSMSDEDQIGYAQGLSGLGKYYDSLYYLQDIQTDNASLLCRLHYLMAVNYLAVGSKADAMSQCGKSVEYMQKLSQKQRNEIDFERIQELCQHLGVVYR